MTLEALLHTELTSTAFTALTAGLSAHVCWGLWGAELSRHMELSKATHALRMHAEPFLPCSALPLSWAIHNMQTDTTQVIHARDFDYWNQEVPVPSKNALPLHSVILIIMHFISASLLGVWSQ